MAASDTSDRQTLTVEEAAAVLGIGRNSAYQAVASGQLPVIRIGRRLLVPRAALERLLIGVQLPSSDYPERRPPR